MVESYYFTHDKIGKKLILEHFFTGRISKIEKFATGIQNTLVI